MNVREWKALQRAGKTTIRAEQRRLRPKPPPTIDPEDDYEARLESCARMNEALADPEYRDAVLQAWDDMADWANR